MREDSKHGIRDDIHSWILEPFVRLRKQAQRKTGWEPFMHTLSLRGVSVALGFLHGSFLLWFDGSCTGHHENQERNCFMKHRMTEVCKHTETSKCVNLCRKSFCHKRNMELYLIPGFKEWTKLMISTECLEKNLNRKWAQTSSSMAFFFQSQACHKLCKQKSELMLCKKQNSMLLCTVHVYRIL